MNIEIVNRKFKTGNVEHELRTSEELQIEPVNNEWFHLLTTMNTILFELQCFSINGNTFESQEELENYLKTIK